jgi:general nucleoside transport system permease protein
MDLATILQILDSTIRLATPLLLACLAGLFSERAGIFDIGLEGKMLISAFFSAAIAAVTGQCLARAHGGIAASLVLSAIHGLASITFRGNQLISGVALNFLAAGITVLIAQAGSRRAAARHRFRAMRASRRSNGRSRAFSAASPSRPVYAEIVSGHTILVYVAMAAVPISWWVLFRTRFGLRLRAVGENPAAVDTAGISVVRLRYAAVAICGLLRPCRGLSRHRPRGGLREGHERGARLHRARRAHLRQVEALARARRLPSLRLPRGVGNRYPNLEVVGVTLPVQFMQALPYILTVVILAGFVGRAIPPRAGENPMSRNAEDLAAHIRAHAGRRACARGPRPRLGPRASRAERGRSPSPTPTCPAFPHAGVSGHRAETSWWASLEGQRVAVLGGRAHYYESGDPAAMRLPLEVLKALGAEILILTNAAGSMRADMPTGSIMCPRTTSTSRASTR